MKGPCVFTSSDVGKYGVLCVKRKLEREGKREREMEDDMKQTNIPGRAQTRDLVIHCSKLQTFQHQHHSVACFLRAATEALVSLLTVQLSNSVTMSLSLFKCHAVREGEWWCRVPVSKCVDLMETGSGPSCVFVMFFLADGHEAGCAVIVGLVARVLSCGSQDTEWAPMTGQARYKLLWQKRAKNSLFIFLPLSPHVTDIQQDDTVHYFDSHWVSLPSHWFPPACGEEAQTLMLSKIQEEKSSIQVSAIIQQHLMVPKVPLSPPSFDRFTVMKCLLTGLRAPESALLNQAC